jgi:hypothetical protein
VPGPAGRRLDLGEGRSPAPAELTPAFTRRRSSGPTGAGERSCGHAIAPLPPVA